MISRIISKIKKDKSYDIQSKYSKREWLIILFERGVQILRGLFSKLFLLKTKGLCFIGRNVSVKHKHLFSAGRNLILDNFVYINALSQKGITLGDNVTISKNCTLICTGVISHKGVGITIGNNTGINSDCYLGGQGGIKIGDNVIIGPNVKIFSENHNFEDASLIIKNQGVTRVGVEIGDDCWIGAGASVLDGVVLQQKTVVAAGSVVTKSFEANSLIAGVPAKLIRKI